MVSQVRLHKGATTVNDCNSTRCRLVHELQTIGVAQEEHDSSNGDLEVGNSRVGEIESGLTTYVKHKNHKERLTKVNAILTK